MKMQWSAKTSLAGGLAMKPTLTEFFAELFKRTDRTNHLVKDCFQLLAILQPAINGNSQVSKDWWLRVVDGASFIGAYLATGPINKRNIINKMVRNVVLSVLLMAIPGKRQQFAIKGAVDGFAKPLLDTGVV
jgi:hypothetical protein